MPMNVVLTNGHVDDGDLQTIQLNTDGTHFFLSIREGFESTQIAVPMNAVRELLATHDRGNAA